jgi:hypothetical protein
MSNQYYAGPVDRFGEIRMMCLEETEECMHFKPKSYNKYLCKNKYCGECLLATNKTVEESL